MFEQAFKNIDDILRKDAGVSNELDYVEQTSWVLFLKYLDDLERTKEKEARLAGRHYRNIIEPKYKWEAWAAPKTLEGKLDHNKALVGDDLIDFVERELFPYFKKFKAEAENPDTIEYKVGEIFGELKNKIQSGYSLREVLNIVDSLHFQTATQKHELSHLYESKIKNMGNAGRNGGEYYTPRSLIKTIVKVVNPKIGDKIYDGAVGSAGFLVEAFEYLKQDKKCALSGLLLNFPSIVGRNDGTASLDRIDSKKGYTIENCQWLHKDVNNLKWDFTQKEIIYYCKLITENQKTQEHTLEPQIEYII